MSTLTIQDSDILAGLEMSIGAPYLSEALVEGIKTEAPALYQMMAIWNLTNAELVGPQGSSEFQEEMYRYLTQVKFLLGTLWTANGKHFPAVSEENIDGCLKDGMYQGSLSNEIEEVSREVWDHFTMISDSIGVHPFGREMLIILAAAFIRAANLELAESARSALDEVTQILHTDKLPE